MIRRVLRKQQQKKIPSIMAIDCDDDDDDQRSRSSASLQVKKEKKPIGNSNDDNE